MSIFKYLQPLSYRRKRNSEYRNRSQESESEQESESNQKYGAKKGPSKLRRTINLSLFFCVTMYLAGSPQLFFSRLEFMPEKYNAAQYAVKSEVKSEDLYIPVANGTKLHAWYFKVPKSIYTVIMHHGQGHNITYFRPSAEVFARAGASVLLYDYEGFGLSDGNPSNAAMRRDAAACYWYARRVLKVAPEHIVQCGISLGTGAASDIAARQPCGGVMLVSPYLRLSKVGKHIVPLFHLYPSIAFPQPDLGSEELIISKSTTPICIIHGDNDPILPVSHADKLYALALGPKKYIRVHDGCHVGGLGAGAETFCKEWLAELKTNEAVLSKD